MYFLRFDEVIILKKNIPEYIYTEYPTKHFFLTMMADKIFTFRDKKTEYLKDRDGNHYQYTEEEILIIKLKAIQFNKALHGVGI